MAGVLTQRKVVEEIRTMDSSHSKPTFSDDRENNVKPGTSALLMCFFGVFFSYLLYGILQENITKADYGKERFRYFMFLVFVQCIINAMVAKSVSLYQNDDVSLKPYSLFGLVSLSYVGAMVASNGALAYISYPTQVLGKSAKPIPVMILGVVINKKSYPFIKYICVLMIVFGVASFMYKDHPSHSNFSFMSGSSIISIFSSIGIGEVLVFVSLCLDGVTGAIQDHLRMIQKTSALHMMYSVNVYAQLYLFIGLILSGEGLDAVAFVNRHPSLIFYFLLFGLSSALGQLFIFTTITKFGPLTCAIITTTRKFFTILSSVIIFGNTLITRQWIAIVLVFTGLGIDAYFGRKKKSLSSQTQTA